VYQIQFAPVPRLPPIIPSVRAEPAHTVEGIAVAELAGVDTVFTVTDVLTHNVVLHAPSALT
jgi:hypothetical protein